jgi:hypothetical protein
MSKEIEEAIKKPEKKDKEAQIKFMENNSLSEEMNEFKKLFD